MQQHTISFLARVRNLIRDSLVLPLYLPMVVLLVSLGATYGVWQSSQEDTSDKLKAEFDFRVRDIVTHLEQRISSYESVFIMTSGFFASSKNVSRNEFKTYIDSLNLEKSTLGIKGIGILQIVPKERKFQHIVRIRKQGFPGYTIFPEGEREIYAPMVMREPFDGSDRFHVGYDMLSESMRRIAMEKARDTGSAASSNKLVLLMETGAMEKVGFVIFLPIYKYGRVPLTIKERRANIIGWIHVPIRVIDLVAGIGGELADDFNVEIFDGEVQSEETMMYSSNGYSPGIKSNTSRLQAKHRIDFAHHQLTLAVHSLPGFDARLKNRKPIFFASTGITLSLLLALITFLLASRQKRALALATKMTDGLRQCEEHFASIMDGTNQGFWNLDLKTHELKVDGCFETMLGFEKGEMRLSPENWLSYIHAADLPIMKESIGLNGKEFAPAHELELRCRMKSGDWKWMLSIGRIVARDKDGSPLAMSGTFSDISVRKKAEKALKLTQFSSDNAVHPICWISPDGFVQFANHSACHHLGYTKEEILGLTVFDFDDLVSVDSWRKLWLEIKGEKFRKFETVHRTKDGRLVQVEIIAKYIKYEGAEYSFAYWIDLTDKKKRDLALLVSHERLAKLSIELIETQEQERKSLARELHDEMGQKFTTLNICLHNMRKFLNGIEAEEKLHEAREQVSALIEYVRTISSSLRPSLLDYFGLESAVQQLLHENFSDSNTIYAFDYSGLPERLPEPIKIAAYRIIQESITNVVRHAGAANVIIEINGGDRGDELEIIIRDNGKGFEAAANRAPIGKSLSFGLIGMHERIKLLGGEFQVLSEVGHGTRINVLIPLERSENNMCGSFDMVIPPKKKRT